MAATTFPLLQSDPLKLKQCFPLRLHLPSPPRFSKFSKNLTFEGQDFAKFNLRCFFFLCEKNKQLTSSNLNSNHLSFSSDDKTPFEIVAETILKALKELKKPAIAAVLLGLLLMYDTNNAALAASGGRIGGISSSSTSSSSKSYSVPSNGGSSFSFIPFLIMRWLHLVAVVGFMSDLLLWSEPVRGRVFFIMIGFAVFVLVFGFLSDSSESGVLTDIERTSVKLQVGLLGMGRSLQRDLNRIAEVAYNSTSEGLNFTLTETTLALLHDPDYCISGYSSMMGRNTSINSRSKNRVNLTRRLVNVGNIRRQTTTSQKAGGFSNEYSGG